MALDSYNKRIAVIGWLEEDSLPVPDGTISNVDRALITGLPAIVLAVPVVASRVLRYIRNLIILRPKMHRKS